MIKFTKTTDFHPKSKTLNSGFDTIIKSEWTYIRLNNHFSVILYWCHVSVAANGFQKFAISLLKMKFLSIFRTTAPLCTSNSGDPRNFNILSHHSYNHFPFYWWGGVIGQFSLVFALLLAPKCFYHGINKGILGKKPWNGNFPRISLCKIVPL